MKHLFLLSLLFTILSCDNSNNSKEQTKSVIENPPSSFTENPPTSVAENPSTTNQNVSSIADTATSRPPEQVVRESVFPIGTYKTLPEIMKHVFSEGSTKNEVRIVQGEPDLVERIDLYQETWYYGNCQVRFNGQMVRSVVNDDKSIRYASLYGTLMFSPDKIESDFAHFLNDRFLR